MFQVRKSQILSDGHVIIWVFAIGSWNRKNYKSTRHMCLMVLRFLFISGSRRQELVSATSFFFTVFSRLELLLLLILIWATYWPRNTASTGSSSRDTCSKCMCSGSKAFKPSSLPSICSNAILSRRWSFRSVPHAIEWCGYHIYIYIHDGFSGFDDDSPTILKGTFTFSGFREFSCSFW